MRAAIFSIAALLAACAGVAPPPAAAPERGAAVVLADAPDTASNSRARSGYNNALLPSLQRTGTVKLSAPLLVQPKPSSQVLKTLEAGAVVRLLGAVDNADGAWLSVAVEDTQGWVRTAQISPDP